MSRKPTKGYFVRGKFVAEGSELDLELKAELKGTYDSTKTDLKRESDALQDLGKELMTLRSDLFKRLQLSDQLIDALAEAKRITNFEGKRRQLQYVGKLMRKLTPEQVASVKQALEGNDDAPVLLTGTIVGRKAGSDDKYIFRDATGELTVDIDKEVFAGRTVTPENTVKLSGKVDKDLLEPVKVDVKVLEILN